MKNIMNRLWKEEDGQDLIEYVLLLALITLIGAASFPAIGAKIATTFSDTLKCLNGTC